MKTSERQISLITETHATSSPEDSRASHTVSQENEKGKDDERHLWPEMLRAIREIQPRWVVGENVRGLVSWNGGMVFEEVQADLEAEGYEVQPFLLPAAGVDAPHERYRIWFVARKLGSVGDRHSHGERRKKRALQEIFGQEQSTEPGRDCENAFAYTDDRCEQEQQGSDTAGRGGSPESRSGVRTCSGGRDFNGESPEGVQQLGRSSSILPEAPSYPNNPRTFNDSGADGNGKTQDEGRFGQPQPEPREDGGYRHASDPDHNGLQGGKVNGGVGEFGKKRKQQPTRLFPPDWKEFPTQSPVCSGDDGFPAESLRQFFREDSNGAISEEEIDKILRQAYSQWRNEAIKAAGNAIVPQVAYQIFKAIEQYENLNIQEP